MKRIQNMMIGAVLAFSMMLVCVMPQAVHADEEKELPTGFRAPEVISISDSEAEVLFRQQERALSKVAGSLEDEEAEDQDLQNGNLTAHSGYNDDYSKYTDDLFYDNMSLVERGLYNSLYSLCNEYLLGTADIPSTKIGNTKFSVLLVRNPMAQAAAKNVLSIFLYNNPQFWFLSDNILTSGNMIGITAYDDFAAGKVRKETTDKMMKVVREWSAEVNAQSSALAKERKAYDLICSHVSYERTTYDQSVYSAFITGKSVCAGYSEAFAMLCNAAGIRTITVTSDAHEWNQVLLDGTWYVVDSTWGDSENAEEFFNRSENAIYAKSSYSKRMHTPSMFWDEYGRPECTTDGIAGVSMYRLYNPNSGEHFYTSNITEQKYLVSVGWKDEGIGWTAPKSGDSVYRLYNPNAGDHFYTLNKAERDHLVSLGWNDEGIGWYSGGDTPLYRAYNPNAVCGSHNYTTSRAEQDFIVSVGWKDEGIGWYGK